MWTSSRSAPAAAAIAAIAVGVPSLADVHHALEHPHQPRAARSPSRRGPAGTVQPMPTLGAPELLIILLVVLVLFGGSKLPQLARSLGQAQNEFKQGIKEGATDDDEAEPKA